ACRTDLARRFERAPWRYSVLCNMLWELLDGRLDREIYRVKVASRRAGPIQPGFAATGPRRRFATTGELYEHLAAIWRNSSIQLAGLSAPNGIQYFHFLQPNQYVADSKPMGPEERRAAYIETHPYRKGVVRGYPLLIREGPALRAAGVRFHDLTRIFA